MATITIKINGEDVDVETSAVARALNTESLADILDSYLNKMSTPGGKRLAEAFFYKHRTIQQNLVRFVWQFILGYADAPGFDLRNEGSVSLCRRIRSLAEDGLIEDGLPFI